MKLFQVKGDSILQIRTDKMLEPFIATDDQVKICIPGNGTDLLILVAWTISTYIKQEKVPFIATDDQVWLIDWLIKFLLNTMVIRWEVSKLWEGAVLTSWNIYICLLLLIDWLITTRLSYVMGPRCTQGCKRWRGYLESSFERKKEGERECEREREREKERDSERKRETETDRDRERKRETERERETEKKRERLMWRDPLNGIGLVRLS